MKKNYIKKFNFQCKCTSYELVKQILKVYIYIYMCVCVCVCIYWKFYWGGRLNKEYFMSSLWDVSHGKTLIRQLQLRMYETKLLVGNLG